MSRFLNEKISGLEPYVPGEQPKERKYIKLNTNESPFPPSENAIKLAREEAERLMLYPDPECRELCLAVAEEYGVSPENVIMTNGSDEVLNFAFMAYCDDNTPAIFPDITYGFYRVFADVNGIPCEEIPLKDDFTVDIEDYVSKRGTVFIANPNAPTGIALPLEKIEELIRANRDRIVVIDEAYVDFGGESVVSLVGKYDNLLVTQTFSKSRSMAGARLGFGIASREIIADLNRIKYSTNPYNINRMTAAAGIGAIKDKDYFVNNCEQIIKNRAYVTEELKNLGFELLDSKTNFVFAKHPKMSGSELYLELRNRGILVRHFNKERISDFLRITIGSEDEMRELILVLTEILEK
ncbi:MAG: histidinol-phosphate transaminase [Clostridia bacterium]|nr:histidinol-phosphate transaminase [Clostridia bacterium]